MKPVKGWNDSSSAMRVKRGVTYFWNKSESRASAYIDKAPAYYSIFKAKPPLLFKLKISLSLLDTFRFLMSTLSSDNMSSV